MRACWILSHALTVGIAVGGCRAGGLDPNDGPDRNTHKKYFPIDSGPHAVDCNTCHGAFDSFAQFDCLTGCHAQNDTDPIHAGNPDYAYTSEKCYSCHPDGTGGISPADHAKYFPIDTGDQHNAVACTTCHADAANRDDVTCTSSTCHVSSDITSSHTQVRDEHTMSNECLACHADSQVDTISSHPRDPGANHEHAGCYSGKACHKTFRTDKPYGVDFTLSDCSSCHDTPTGPSGD